MAQPNIPITRPWLGVEEQTAAARPIASGWVMQGPEVEAFESAFAEYVGSPYACAVSSATAGLHLALHALGVGPGDEVVTVSHSFVATANAAHYVGALPVFVDVDPVTRNVTAEGVAAALTTATRAIIVAHQVGMPAELAPLVAVAERAGVPLIEDAACAIGSEYRWNGSWERIGRPRGTLAVFSFHPRKLLTTGDGGMVTTRDASLDERIRGARSHGMVRTPTGTDVPAIGFNFRMTDIQAAVGQVQLAKVPAMVARRREQAERYAELLRDVEGVSAPHEPEWARSNWQSYGISLEGAARSSDPAAYQRDVIGGMAERGVTTQAGVMNAHELGAYAETPWRGPEGGLPGSATARDTTLLLPVFHELPDGDLERIVAELRVAIAVAEARRR